MTMQPTTTRFGPPGWLFARVYQKRQQRLRDQRAAATLSDVKAGRQRPYSLYLRGFATTGKLPLLAAGHAFERRGNPEPHQDMESLVAQAMESSAPLIALGNPGEQIGAGRVATSEEDWQDDFRLLASGARALFLLPTDTQGTLFEIDRIIKQQLWHKTILLMPLEDRSYKWAEQWASMQMKVTELAPKLPQYRPCGMVFTVGRHGQVELFQPLGHDHRNVGGMAVDLLSGRGIKLDEDLIECPACGYCERRVRPGQTVCQFCKGTVG